MINITPTLTVDVSCDQGNECCVNSVLYCIVFMAVSFALGPGEVTVLTYIVDFLTLRIQVHCKIRKCSEDYSHILFNVNTLTCLVQETHEVS